MKTTYKKWLLAGALISTLALSGCYMAPDQGAIDDTNNLTVGNNNLPFDQVAPIPTETPTPTPTVKPTASLGQVDWDSNWGTTITNAPNPGVNIGQTVTLPPISANTYQPSTQRPTTAVITATPAPTSSTLKLGASGSTVREMQQRLKDLKYYTGSVDGDFGAGTEAAVREFQQNNGLTVDGKAGKKTLEALYSYYAVPKSGSSTTTATKKPTAKPSAATPTPAVSDNTYLKVGSSGSKVRVMQERLITLGYLAGKADGSFGESTEAAVKAFQSRNSLWDDGIAGPDTLRLLYSNSAKKAGSVASIIGDTLEEGATGSAVRALQKKLIALGYLKGTADGDFGAATKNAVIAFQKNNGLTADGRAGTATMNKLYSDDARSANESSSSSSSSATSSTGYTTLEDGAEGAQVKKVQQALKNLGYYKGSVDGKYGAGTAAAVKEFQRVNNLTVDGKAGPATQRMLFGGNAAEANTSTLEYGSEGSAVTSLQYALYELGYYQGRISGVYNTDTQNAVREFQMNNDLTVDGKAGKKTLEVLYSAYAKPAASESVEYTTVQKGEQGEKVYQIQNALYQLGYMSDLPSGIFDNATESALKAFQVKNKLSPVDGIAGPATQAQLFSSGAVANK